MSIQFSSVQLLSRVRLCQLYLNKWVFQCHTFLPFHTFHGVLKARILSGLPFPSPADHLLSELSTMSHLPWVALQGMAHSFTELDKIVVHIISLVSFLWFILSSLWWIRIRGLWKLLDGRDWLRNQISNCQHPLDHWKSKRFPEKHLLLIFWLCQSLWLCGSQQTVKNS